MKKPLLLLSCLLLLLVTRAQRTITGKITDQNGAPVANASVAVKGSARGTTSDIAGNYFVALCQYHNQKQMQIQL